MADMLVVATFKFSNPVLFFVKVKADNPLLHVPAKRQAPTSPIGAVGLHELASDRRHWA
jgi:hypothetical protein